MLSVSLLGKLPNVMIVARHLGYIVAGYWSIVLAVTVTADGGASLRQSGYVSKILTLLRHGRYTVQAGPHRGARVSVVFIYCQVPRGAQAKIFELSIQRRS